MKNGWHSLFFVLCALTLLVATGEAKVPKKKPSSGGGSGSNSGGSGASSGGGNNAGDSFASGATSELGGQAVEQTLERVREHIDTNPDDKDIASNEAINTDEGKSLLTGPQSPGFETPGVSDNLIDAGAGIGQGDNLSDTGEEMEKLAQKSAGGVIEAESEAKRLSAGAIAGIVLGSIFGALVLAGAAYVAWIRPHRDEVEMRFDGASIG